MARNRFIKTHSNYTLQQVHQTTNIGKITERDWMTIADLNTYAPGSLPAYGLNGFKMVISDGVNLKKRHQYGSWKKNDKSDVWSLDSMESTDEIPYKSSTSLILKPNYSSILDFAYFGSATKMMESSIVNIIKKFPAEVYLRENYILVDNTRLYFTDNPFGIEFDTVLFEENKDINLLRIFSKSFDNYNIIDANGNVGTLSWNRDVMNNDPCTENGNLLSIIDLGYPYDSTNKLILYYYNYSGVKTLFHNGVFTNASIRPSKKIINSFFNNLTDFESLLLNKKTNYTAYLNTPEETEGGNIFYEKKYTWPKTGIGEWNISNSGSVYETYINSLLDITEFYDSYFTDNLWSSMTHESIINFDWTLNKINNNGEAVEFSTPESQRVKAFIQIMGRNFDDLKRYIDGISFSNAVTYDEANNNPDCFLGDSLTNYGWDVKTPISTNLSKYITNPLYSGFMDGYTVQDANFEFYRRLLLNTGAILSSKGTKRSIEMVLSLFGYRSHNFIEHAFHDVYRNGELKTIHWSKLNDDEKKDIFRNAYDITEYIYVTDKESKGFESVNVDRVKTINSLKFSYNEDNLDEYQGIPVREVVTTTKEPILGLGYENGILSTGITIGHIDVDKHYLIPWFDKNKEYDADIYYESKGGWGLTMSKTNEVLGYGEKYYETGEGLKIYDESVKYLKFKDNIEDLLNMIGEIPIVNDVYYVYDISGADNYDWGLLGEEELPTMSHYFILKDIDFGHIFGVRRDDDGRVMLSENHGGVVNEEKYGGDNSVNVNNPETINGYPNIFWKEIPTKLYGWKNISEEELRANKTKDSQRVFYLEGIVENNLGNNPHVGYGNYDDGESYKRAFENIFEAAIEEDEFYEVGDSILTDNNGFSYTDQIFTLEKMIDNVKCWYFTDFNEEQSLKVLSKLNEHKYQEITTESPSVGDMTISVREFVERSDERMSGISDEMFNTEQYSTLIPVNMEGGNVDDEASANSIVNSKSFYIEFNPDYRAPDSMYEFIDDIAMHYAKQVIPSTTLLKYKVPVTGWDTFCSKRTYLQSAFFE